MSGAPRETPRNDGRCFGCGPLSTIGLRMPFEIDPDDRSVESRIAVGRAYTGWEGIVHGGIVSLILDEAMGYAATACGVLAMTGDLKVRFRKSVLAEAPLVVRAAVAWRRRGVLGIVASIATAEDGTVLASGEGTFVKVGDVEPATFGESRYRAPA